MRFLFFSAPMLLLQYRFMASLLAMATVINNLTTDQSALLAFKADVTDSRSVLANNWSISYPICNWVGISCGARHHRVVALNLSSFSLGGIIPPHLGNLSFLVSLDISENNFYGHLPNELGKLRRLRLINFAYNELSGIFPSWIGILSRLQILSFHNNSFTDRIPDFLLNLSKLEFLNLMENSLSGSLPNDMCSRLPKLEKLYLGSNDFFGQIPSSLSECTHLQTLWLADNKLIGRLPESIGNLSKLTLLNLAHNNLQGPIPRSFYDISSLTKIDLGFNSLSGSLPNDMCSRLPKLEKLYLGSNDFFGQIPSSLSECTHLQTLWLADNKFSGRLPENIGNLSQLTDLNLAQNNLQEYGSEGIVSAKCDVYSYGVLLMETFTRKKPTDEMFTGEMSLRRWVKESLPHGLTEVVDANLVGEEQAFSAKTDCLLSIMDLALDCCMESPEQRIHMTDTAAELKKIRVKFLQQSSVAGTN